MIVKSSVIAMSDDAGPCGYTDEHGPPTAMDDTWLLWWPSNYTEMLMLHDHDNVVGGGSDVVGGEDQMLWGGDQMWV